jgi:hypothetical protein
VQGRSRIYTNLYFLLGTFRETRKAWNSGRDVENDFSVATALLSLSKLLELNLVVSPNSPVVSGRDIYRGLAIRVSLVSVTLALGFIVREVISL